MAQLRNPLRPLTLLLNLFTPSLALDVIFHPIDFASVLVQVGYNPEEIGCDAVTIAGVFMQYAIMSLYVPLMVSYSSDETQLMRVPSPGMHYYLSYIYKHEGVLGCYRGIIAKVFERLTLVNTIEAIRHVIRGEGGQQEDNTFLTHLVNNVCCHFFGVVCSHPFHVIMVNSFKEFINESPKHSSMTAISQAIWHRDGGFGFFIGLAPRLLGELLSLIFSISLTWLLTRRGHEETAGTSGMEMHTSVIVASSANLMIPSNNVLSACIATFTHNRMFEVPVIRGFNMLADPLAWPIVLQQPPLRRLLDHIPITSKIFYYTLLRDFLAKKISYPFFLVCHSMIVEGSGWEKLPLLVYCEPFVSTFAIFMPRREKDNYDCHKT